jgi:hypothetical protein
MLRKNARVDPSDQGKDGNSINLKAKGKGRSFDGER